MGNLLPPSSQFWAAARVHLSSVHPALQQRSASVQQSSIELAGMLSRRAVERDCVVNRVLIEMPSVTTLAFNYLSCWQLEVGSKQEKRRKAVRSRRQNWTVI